jgi:hypothetical protein
LLEALPHPGRKGHRRQALSQRDDLAVGLPAPRVFAHDIGYPEESRDASANENAFPTKLRWLAAYLQLGGLWGGGLLVAALVACFRVARSAAPVAALSSWPYRTGEKRVRAALPQQLDQHCFGVIGKRRPHVAPTRGSLHIGSLVAQVQRE